MAASFVLLLSCLVYGAVAHPPTSSYLPPGGAVGGRPTVQGLSVSAPTVGSRPSSSYLPPTKSALNGRPNAQTPGLPLLTPNIQQAVASGSPAYRTGGRPGDRVSGHAISSPVIQRPVNSVATIKPISSPLVASPRLISSGRRQSTYKAEAPSASGPRTVGTHAPY